MAMWRSTARFSRALAYPDWFDTAAWPAAEAAQSLSDDGLLEPDPRTPMRRVRDHAGQRWLVLTAQVSRHLCVLLDGPGLAQAASAPESAQGGAAPASSADGAADPDQEPKGDDARGLVEVILRDLGAQSEPCDGSHTQILDHATLKALAKQHRLGVYSLRERLLTDPRITEDAHKRLVVTR